ncbi:dihydrofolate reductase family protein [Streptoalloteichus hindustanus]|uniref:Dihydrofolate reductase n=1 Tax=Streptoalloteichus hindustanus TaxID=2017 RepID=A0A1M5Q2C3_STRHI|nr:dihydrofolate reductase family protein [Streptoalloteichus hindustanus]SHH08112.1 Dihydrofolate reductase [Streptoalloteichus hindustanus]
MRKLTYLVATTLDGFVADPSGSNPAAPGGFFLGEGDHIEAIFTDYAEIIPVQAREALGIAPENQRFDTVLEGRGSYEVGLREGIPDAYPHLRHYVFSRTMAESPAPAVQIVATDPVEKVRELKREDGLGIWLCGGGQIAAVLLPEIDELILKVHPVVIGSGIPLFSGRGFEPHRFDLVDSHAFTSGVVHLTYARRQA